LANTELGSTFQAQYITHVISQP